MPTQEETWAICRFCGAQVLAKNLDRHIRKVHQGKLPEGQAHEGKARQKRVGRQALRQPSEVPVRIFHRETVKCSTCGAMVKRVRMEEHIRTQHPQPGNVPAPEKQPSSAEHLVKCTACGASVHRDRLKNHMERVHQAGKKAGSFGSSSGRAGGQGASWQPDLPDEDFCRKDRLVRCKSCGVYVERSVLDSHRCKEQDIQRNDQETSTQLILFSDRYTEIRSGGCCSECGFSSGTVWRYRESNRGAVDLCSECRPKVLDRSFGEEDTMDHAWTSSFESSRRRH